MPHRFLLHTRGLVSNIIAGVIVGIVALPLAMAFAIASGAKPEQGIYTAIFAGAIVSLAGGSKVQIAGPTGAFVVILSAITAKYGIDGLQTATLMAGGMLLLMGLLRLGSIVRFMPYPVILGFTTGIAVVIWIGQWQDFFGLPPVPSGHFHQKLIFLLQALPHFQTASLALGMLSLLTVIFWSRLPRLNRIPGPAAALVLTTGLQGLFQLPTATIGSAFGGIPTGLPAFSLPNLAPGTLLELAGPAFTIAMLGAIESLLSAVVADGMLKTRHDSNRELIGQGLGNIVAPMFGGFAATGAIARTATNVRNGGTSPLAGIVHAITLLMVILFLAPLAANIPLAALAGILFVVAWNMAELPHFARLIRRAPRMDVVILLTTFLLTVFMDLVIAVNIGVILAVIDTVRRMAGHFAIHTVTGTQYDNRAAPAGSPPPLPAGVMAFELDGPFFFATAEAFEHAIMHTGPLPQILILDLARVPFMDMTGIRALEEVITSQEQRGVIVLLCQASDKVREKLDRSGITGLVGQARIFGSQAEAVAYCTRRLNPGSDTRDEGAEDMHHQMSPSP